MQDYNLYSAEYLLEGLSKADEGCFRAIYEQYWERLFEHADKILNDRSAAQDVVQEVFISLWKRRFSLEIDNLQAYLFQAVRFQVFKAIRAHKTGQNFYKRLAGISAELLSEDHIVFKELENYLFKILETLPEDQREIFKMNKIDGYTYKEIAEAKHISIKTVEKKMSLALKQIRPHLEKGMGILIIICVAP